jgi:TolB protein
MSARFSKVISIIVLILFTGCSGTQSATSTTVLTASPLPSLTTQPTETILPTETVSPIPTETALPPPTESPVPTDTPTPLPPLSGSGGGIIAFDSERDGNPEVYLMNADGSDPRRMTHDRFGDYMGDWSPDGSRIIFHSTRDQNEELFWLDLTAETGAIKPQRITDDPAIDTDASWSPDGTHIVFESHLLREGDVELVILDLENNRSRQLTDNNISDFNPDWSPNGEQIVFVAQLEETAVNMFTIKQDGRGRQQLTYTDAHDWYPSWSPDGLRIAFASDRDGDIEIFVMNSDGSNPRQLTFNDAAEDNRPSWSPDGSKLIFESDRDGDFEIYLIDVEEALQSPGSHLEQQLTDNDVDDRRAVWKPVPVPIEPALSIEVPPGDAPTINGRLSEGEWDGAQVVLLTGGGELHLLHADGYLFLGIRGQEPGIGSVCHYQNGKISVMHASAGLNTSIYEQGAQDWDVSTRFYGCCMDLPETMRRDEQLKDQGWVANLFDKGLPNEMEYQITLGDGDLILAVTYILLDAPTFVWWPKDLDDDCGKLELVEEIPDISHLQFAPETWVKIILLDD